MLKLSIYIFVFPFVVWTLDAININSIFKKNKVIQARIFYLFLIFSLSYLVVNFIYDFITVMNWGVKWKK